MKRLKESEPLKSQNKSILEYWKEKMLETLSTIYGDKGINKEKLELFLNELTNRCSKPVAKYRNLYKGTTWEAPLDDTLKTIDANNLIILANGSLQYNQKVKINECSELLEKWMSERKVLKNKSIEAEETGNQVDFRKFDNLQNSKKELANSTYGVSAMNGFILYSPDTASAITAQGRELISENLWTLEKLLGSNLTFSSMNEFYAFINETVRDEIDLSMIEEYKIKIPTFKMLKERLKELLSYIPKEEKEGIDNFKSLFIMLKNIEKDPVKSINFYYKYNMYKFLMHNPKVMGIINWIMREKKIFDSPYKSVMKKEESVIYIEPLEKMVSIFLNFLILPIPTHDRVSKYLTRGRKSVILSDTDSVITRFDKWIEFCNSFGEVKFDTFYDNDDVFRAANTISFICTELINFMSRTMAKYSYVPNEYRPRINLKNEFFFKSLIIYPNIKKNYSAFTILREGTRINKVANTGLALEGSNIVPYVKNILKKIIFEEIHSVKDVSVTRIVKRIYDLEKDIKHRVLVERDITFTKFSSYKNSNNVKPYSDSRIRAVLLWNHIYPEKKIEFYNKIYIVNTILERREQLYLIKDPKIRSFIEDKLFINPVDKAAVPFGLRTIAIPDSFTKIPEWITDIIDINNLIEFHLKSFSSLLPSIGLHVNRVSSTRNHLSSMIKL